MDTVITYLYENWPFGIWLIVGGVIMWLYTQVLNKASNANKKAAEAHDKIDRLPLVSHAEKMNSIEVKVAKLDGEIDRLPCDSHAEKININEVMNAKLDGIVQMLQSSVFPKNPIILAQSPINLTDFGKQLVEELGIASYVNAKWEIISACIEKNAASMNPYDIQQFCFNYVFSNSEYILTKEGYDKLKSKAFSIGAPAFNLLQAVAIVIRNRYFEERGLNIDDVDDFVPVSE